MSNRSLVLILLVSCFAYYPCKAQEKKIYGKGYSFYYKKKSNNKNESEAENDAILNAQKNALIRSGGLSNSSSAGSVIDEIVKSNEEAGGEVKVKVNYRSSDKQIYTQLIQGLVKPATPEDPIITLDSTKRSYRKIAEGYFIIEKDSAKIESLFSEIMKEIYVDPLLDNKEQVSDEEMPELKFNIHLWVGGGLEWKTNKSEAYINMNFQSGNPYSSASLNFYGEEWNPVDDDFYFRIDGQYNIAGQWLLDSNTTTVSNDLELYYNSSKLVDLTWENGAERTLTLIQSRKLWSLNILDLDIFKIAKEHSDFSLVLGGGVNMEYSCKDVVKIVYDGEEVFVKKASSRSYNGARLMLHSYLYVGSSYVKGGMHYWNDSQLGREYYFNGNGHQNSQFAFGLEIMNSVRICYAPIIKSLQDYNNANYLGISFNTRLLAQALE